MRHFFMLFLLCSFINGYSQKMDTSEVYFELNIAKVSTMASMALDSLSFAKAIIPGKKTTLLGYGDYLGTDEYNMVLSQNRANNVKAYLLALGLDEGDIVECKGKGRIKRTPLPGEIGFYKDRKVMIITQHAPKKAAVAATVKPAPKPAPVKEISKKTEPVVAKKEDPKPVAPKPAPKPLPAKEEAPKTVAAKPEHKTEPKPVVAKVEPKPVAPKPDPKPVKKEEPKPVAKAEPKPAPTPAPAPVAAPKPVAAKTAAAPAPAPATPKPVAAKVAPPVAPPPPAPKAVAAKTAPAAAPAPATAPAKNEAPKTAEVKRRPEKNLATLDPSKLQINEVIPVNNIFFAQGSNAMLRRSQPALDELYKFLNDNKNLSVEIQGHICCLDPTDGTDEPDGLGGNRSEGRAKNIYIFLTSKGIDQSRVKFVGLGNRKPTVYPEKTDADRELNNRPTLRIINK